MPNLEPSYLRYIHDGLEKGKLHPDNAAALPEGITGLYEEAFEESKPARERQKLLDNFAIWALLKKEVSAQFVAEILEVPTQEIIDFIATYSSWFTSPESGKYQLYHERLKVYLLQKLSAKELDTLHEKLIVRLEQAIDEQKEDEFELYGLEFLSYHLLVEGFVRKTGTKLLTFTKNNTVWDRQIQLSNKFEWSKKGIHHAASWTSKHDNEENIFCYLDLVELHHKEQNDAESIVRLVAENKIDLALERITAFGGPSKEEKQRQFILFMLCLMELTLLGSKDKVWRKEAIEKLLIGLEKEIPVDYSIVNWNDFFPSYLVFKITCELKILDIGFQTINERTDKWDKRWVSESLSYIKIEYDVLLELGAKMKENLEEKVIFFCKLSSVLAKQGSISEAMSLIKSAIKSCEKITDEKIKSNLFRYISIELSVQGKLKEAIKYSKKIIIEYEKQLFYNEFSIILIKKGDIEEAIEIARNLALPNYLIDDYFSQISFELIKKEKVKEALEFTHYVKDTKKRKKSIYTIFRELIWQGRLIKALEQSNLISDNKDKSYALYAISIELVKTGDLENGLFNARKISAKKNKIYVLSIISTEFSEQGKHIESSEAIKECLKCIHSIKNFHKKSIALSNLSTELFVQGKFDQAELLIQQSIDYIFKIKIISDKYKSLSSLSIELTLQGDLDYALYIVGLIDESYEKDIALGKISLELALLGKFDEAYNLIQDINSSNELNCIIDEIAIELALQGNIEKAIDFSKLLDESSHIIGRQYNSDLRDSFGNEASTLSVISYELTKLGKIDEAIIFINEMSSKEYQNLAFRNIFLVFAKQNKYSELMSFIKNNILIFKRKIDFIEKDFILKDITLLLAKKTITNDAYYFFSKINSSEVKYQVLEKIITDLVKQNNIQLAFELARRLTDENENSFALNNISFNLVEIGKIDEAINCASMINCIVERSYAYRNISNFFAKKGKFNEAIESKNKIIIRGRIAEANQNISIELARHGKVKEALQYARGIEFENIITDVLINISKEISAKEKLNEFENFMKKIFKKKEFSEYEIYKCAIELVKSEKIQDGLDYAIKISKFSFKNKVLKEISELLIKKNKIKEASYFVDKIITTNGSSAIRDFITEIVNKGNVNEAIECINDNLFYDKEYYLIDVTYELVKQFNFKLAEKIGFEIQQTVLRQLCWKKIAKSLIEEKGITYTLESYVKFKSEEVRTYYLKSWAENLRINVTTEELILKALFYLKSDVESIEQLLRTYSIYELFFGNETTKKIHQYNRIVNIQWAIDIKKELDQIPN
jgi:tetratricopeptide (TPR) repeat protein